MGVNGRTDVVFKILHPEFVKKKLQHLAFLPGVF